jgi:hypothetical protein
MFSGGANNMNPQDLMRQSLPNPAQQVQQQPQGFNINPASLLGVPPPQGNKGLNTLLAVLGSIGALGGTAANVVGGLKGTGAPGDSSLAQSSGIFGQLLQQKKVQQEYEQKKAMLEGLPPEVATQFALGGGDAAAKYISDRNKPVDRKTQLEIQKAERDLNEHLTPQQEAELKLKTDKEMADYKAGVDARTGKTKPLSGEAARVLSVAQGGLEQLDRLTKAYNASGTMAKVNAMIPGGMLQENARELRTVSSDLADRITRLRSGAAVTESEEKRFKALLPSPLNSAETNQKNLDALRLEFQRVEQSIISGPPKGGALNAGHVEDGYRYLGGSPDKPSSWEKVK